jgi:hypothetical protein
MPSAFTSIQSDVAGDSTVALVAQLNRFRVRDKLTPFPLAETQIGNAIALYTLSLLRARIQAAMATDPSAGSALAEIESVIVASSDSNAGVTYVSGNVTQITQILAIYGDSLHLPPAAAGITKRDPAFTKKRSPLVWVAAIGGLAVAAVGASYAAKRLARS